MRAKLPKITEEEMKELEQMPLEPTGESIPVDCKVGLPKFTKIMIADNPQYYDEKFFLDWETKNITCTGVTKDFKEVLIKKNFSRRCDASRWIRKNFPKVEIQQWYY